MPTNKMYQGFRNRIKEGTPNMEEQAENTRKHLAKHIMGRRNVTQTKLSEKTTAKSPESAKGEER